MITVEYLGRTGNNLFQYALGRILATELKHELSASPIEGFPGTYEPVHGLKNTSDTRHHSGHIFPWDEVFHSTTRTSHILRGYFQRSEYYIPYRAALTSWLRFQNQDLANLPKEFLANASTSVVVNVRRTDYTQNGWALPASYYHHALTNCNLEKNKLWIVTEDPHDPFFLNFRSYQPRYLKLSAISELAAMSIANTLIMSASTFSWWGAFLGKQENVICPKPTFGVWSVSEVTSGIDLLSGMDFQLLDCDTPYHPTSVEAAYQNIRLLKRKWILRANRWLRLGLKIPPQ